MPEPTQSSGWAIARMETLSWLNIAVAALIGGTALLLDLPGWTFWTAIVVAGTVLVLEVFDEWAERRGLAAEVVGPESVVVVASLWLVGTVLVVGGPPAFVTIGVVGGLLLVVTSAMNMISSAKMDTTSEYEDR